MLVVNLFAGPGAGKSTLAALVFAALKRSGHGLVVEQTVEVAKEFVWEGREAALQNRVYVLGRQFFRTTRLERAVDVVVTDSPVLLNVAYARMEGGWPECYMDLCLWAHRAHGTVDVFVDRPVGFEAVGRREDEAGAIALDRRIEAMLEECGVACLRARSTPEDAERIAAEVLRRLSPRSAA